MAPGDGAAFSVSTLPFYRPADAQREMLDAANAWIAQANQAVLSAPTPADRERARADLRDARAALRDIRIMGPGAWTEGA